MRTILITALLCTASLLVPAAHAQQGDAGVKELAELRTKAEKGDAQAQFELGQVFALGIFDVPTNYLEAAEWFRKAADQNWAKAQFTLGVYCERGDGVAQDYAQAVDWYRKAAKQNYAPAQVNLGLCYRHGNGVTTNSVEAVT